MNETERPTRFYIFPKGSNYKIMAMTDTEAVKYWQRGEHWVDMPQKSQEDAEEIIRQLLSNNKR
jgi:hypothetical protein